MFILLSLLSPALSQDKTGDDQEPKDPARLETVKYFKTRLSRKDLLTDEVASDKAKKMNHFQAVYDHRGELIRVEFVPAGDRLRDRIKKRELFPRPQPPFRYYLAWNPHTGSLDKEMPPRKVGNRPFYRASFLDSVHVKTVEYYRRINRLLWTYHLKWDKEKNYSKVSVVFSTRRPLTALDPHLFHPSASEMKPGWFAEFSHNRVGRPIGAAVKDPVGNMYYFYRFKHGYETTGDTLNPIVHRVTTSEYYRSDSTLMGSHRLVFSDKDRLLKKAFLDAHGLLTETIEYKYNAQFQEVSVLIRDPKGNILHRQVISR